MDAEEEEGNFKFNFVPTLQHMAQVKVASILLVSSRFSYHLRTRSLFKIAKNRIEELPLPGKMKEDLTLVASNLMDEIEKWCSLSLTFGYEYIILSYLHKIQWTCHGLIHDRETAKLIYHEIKGKPCVSKRLYYYYCLKEGKEVDLADIYFSFKKLKSGMNDECLDLQTLRVRIPNFFDFIAKETHEGIFMTVWNLSNDKQKKTLLRKVEITSFWNPDLIMFILSQMSIGNRHKYFIENVDHITRVLSHWLWVDKATDIILKGYVTLSPPLLLDIFSNLSMNNDQGSSYTAFLLMLKNDRLYSTLEICLSDPSLQERTFSYFKDRIFYAIRLKSSEYAYIKLVTLLELLKSCLDILALFMSAKGFKLYCKEVICETLPLIQDHNQEVYALSLNILSYLAKSFSKEEKSRIFFMFGLKPCVCACFGSPKGYLRINQLVDIFLHDEESIAGFKGSLLDHPSSLDLTKNLIIKHGCPSVNNLLNFLSNDVEKISSFKKNLFTMHGEAIILWLLVQRGDIVSCEEYLQWSLDDDDEILPHKVIRKNDMVTIIVEYIRRLEAHRIHEFLFWYFDGDAEAVAREKESIGQSVELEDKIWDAILKNDFKTANKIVESFFQDKEGVWLLKRNISERIAKRKLSYDYNPHYDESKVVKWLNSLQNAYDKIRRKRRISRINPGKIQLVLNWF